MTELTFELVSLGLVPTFHCCILPFIIVQACDLEDALSPLLPARPEVQLHLVWFLWSFLPSLGSFVKIVHVDTAWPLHLALIPK